MEFLSQPLVLRSERKSRNSVKEMDNYYDIDNCYCNKKRIPSNNFGEQNDHKDSLQKVKVIVVGGALLNGVKN